MAARFAPRLVVMVKVPIAGQVKTRLAQQIGIALSAAFCRHTMAVVLQRLGRSPRWRTYLAVTPDNGVSGRCWPAHLPRLAQGRCDLGARMQRVMDRPWKGPVVIIGTDIPAIQPAHIAEAFRRLGDNDAVFGPAADGGYWLVGLKRLPCVLRAFGSVRWSSPHALADTRANLAGRRVAEVARLQDVDTGEDYRRVAAWCGRRVLPVR